MTISTEATRLSYAGDDTTTAFAVTWQYFAKGDVLVTLRDANDDETVQVLDTDYTLTAAGSGSGTVTMTTAPASGETLIIQPNPDNVQDEDIVAGGSFPATKVEDGLDKLALEVGKLEVLIEQCIKTPTSDTQVGANTAIPIDADRASKALGFDGLGKPTAISLTTGTGGNISGDLVTATGETTARTLADHFGDIQTPQGHGAAGDGTTDDSTEFTAAEAVAKLTFIPSTANGYEFTTAVSTDTGAWLPDPTLTWSELTDDGQLDMFRGTHANLNNGANIWRLSDRVFIGRCASETDGGFKGGGGGTSWMSWGFVPITSGGTYEPQVGDILTGQTGGGTREIVKIDLISGTWAGGNAVADLVYYTHNATGVNFVNGEILDIGANTDIGETTAAHASYYPTYLARPATLLVTADNVDDTGGSSFGIVAAGRSSDNADNKDCFVVGIIGVNDEGATAGVCAGIEMEMQRDNGSGYTASLELQNKNKGSDTTWDPYQDTNNQGMYGVIITAGGDSTFGGDALNPCDTALQIRSNPQAAVDGWNKGIIFHKTGITGSDGTTGTGIAIEMARGHKINWLGPSGVQGFAIWSEADTNGQDMEMLAQNNAIRFRGANSVDAFRIIAVSNGDSRIFVQGAVSGVAPQVRVGGTGNVDLKLDPLGSGVLQLGYEDTAAGTPANFSADRIIQIKDNAGNSLYIPAMTATW